MRTNVALESIHRLVQGNHHNPFELLGPHIVDDSGRQALAVRAFLPDSAQAWVVDSGKGETARPMRRIHPAGLFEAICPMPGQDGPITIHAAFGRRGRNENDNSRSVCVSPSID